MHLRLTTQLQNSICFHPAPFLTHPGLTRSLIHIQPPFISPGPPSPTQPSIHTNTPIHSLTNSPPFRQHTLTHKDSFSQTPTSSHTPLHSRPSLHTHTPHLPAHGPPSLMHKPSLTPWLLGVNTKMASVPQPGHEYRGRRHFSFSYYCQSLVGEMRSPSFIKLLDFISHW